MEKRDATNANSTMVVVVFVVVIVAAALDDSLEVDEVEEEE